MPGPIRVRESLMEPSQIEPSFSDCLVRFQMKSIRLHSIGFYFVFVAYLKCKANYVLPIHLASYPRRLYSIEYLST